LRKGAGSHGVCAVTRPLAKAFWNWSLQRYAREGVETHLLKLQDEYGFNVNLLLWSCWSAEHFCEIPESCFRKAHELTAAWSASVTAPLRSVRRFLKAPPEPFAAGAALALREDIKTAELNAEAIEQDLLQNLAANALTPAANDEDATPRARRNLALYTALAGAAKRPGFSTLLLESLIGHIFPGEDPAVKGPGENP